MTSNISALLGDEFPKEQYASLLVRIETSLLIGRLSNLALMVFFMQDRNYAGYFETSAFLLSLSVPVYYLLERARSSSWIATQRAAVPSIVRDETKELI